MGETIFPKGFYCYTPVSIEVQDTGFIYRIKPCPFYVYKDNLIGVCSALNAEIEDQVKVCSINEFTDEELESMNEV